MLFRVKMDFRECSIFKYLTRTSYSITAQKLIVLLLVITFVNLNLSSVKKNKERISIMVDMIKMLPEM